jgi:hypothetical protein
MMKTTLIPVTVEPSTVDWEFIDLFRTRFTTLWNNLKDLKLGQFHGSFAKQPDGRYAGGFVLPNEYRLKGLYVDFRHFYLEKEATNVRKFANYLVSITESDDYRRFIKEEKGKLQSEFVENGWFRFKGKPFTTKQLMDIWFNAEIFHADTAKIATMRDWAAVLAADTAKSMFFMATYDSMLVVRNINWSALELSKDNMYLRMPSKTFQPIAKKTGSW